MSEASLGLPVEDRLQILDLYARQSHYVDEGQAADWARTYTVDGVFVSPTFQLVARGHQALEDFARNSHQAARDRGEQLRHHISAVVLEQVESGVVWARAYLMILATSRAGTRIDRSMRLIDSLAKVDDAWLFTSREIVRDDANLAPAAQEAEVQ